MSSRGVLSSKFNMSLGFLPLVLTMLLAELFSQRIAIGGGLAAGVLYILYPLRKRGALMPRFLLYITIVTLLLFSLFLSFFRIPEEFFSFVLEITLLLPVFFLFLRRNAFIECQASQTIKCGRQLFAQGAESAIVSSKTTLLLAGIHLGGVLLAFLFRDKLYADTNDWMHIFLFRVAPPLVFLLSVIINQFEILYFNRIMKHTAFVPIVNKKGDVIGKSLAMDAINCKNDYINPVIRIAVSHRGMLYLRSRSQCCLLDACKTDLPMECYLLYGESLEQGIQRLMTQVFPIPLQMPDICCSAVYHFENELTNRLIYLFVVDVEDENLLCRKRIKEGKLWTFKQMEHNLGKHFFSACLEYEYEHLKDVIGTKEKYKEF